MTDHIRNRIVLKLWLTIVAMVLFVFLLLTTLLHQFLDGFVWQQQAPQLRQVGAMAQYLAEHKQTAAIRQLARIHHVQVLFGPLDSHSPALEAKLDALTPSQRHTVASGGWVVERLRVTGQSDFLRAYLPLPDARVIVVSQNTSILAQPLGELQSITIFAMVLGIVMATGLAFVISNNLSRPLVQMNAIAEAMAKGNFGGTIDVMTDDEVGRLARTFNELAAKLRQSIDTLNVERDQLSSILTSLQDGVIAADIHGNITLTNPPGLRRLSSIWLSDSGQPHTHRLPEPLQAMLVSVLELNASLVREFAWQDRQIQITMAPLYDPATQRSRGTVAVLRDVTEERRLDRLRKDFLANVSHELRTPLSMMQGYSEALLDEFGDDPLGRRALTEIIHDESLRMRRLVNDLLDLAQLESGQFQMRLAQVDVAALLGRVVRKFRTLAQDEGVQLEHPAGRGDLLVNGDEDRLEQVFTNLVDNAVRHTAIGGRVTVSAQLHGLHAKMRVSDTGSGIPAEDLPYIWERFYKADKARTRGRAGIGLGLAITRHIVNAHHGEIVVDSRVGQGTTFTVLLPLAPQHPATVPDAVDG